MKYFRPNGELSSGMNAQLESALAPYKKLIKKQDGAISELNRELKELKVAAAESVIQKEQQQQTQNAICNGVNFKF